MAKINQLKNEPNLDAVWIGVGEIIGSRWFNPNFEYLRMQIIQVNKQFGDGRNNIDLPMAEFKAYQNLCDTLLG